jgi:hypothetical protein
MTKSGFKPIYSPIRTLFWTLVYIAAGVALSGCSHFQAHHDDQSHNHPAHTSSDSKQGGLQLSLNGEEKWLMDTHTRSVLGAMQDKVLASDIASKTEAELIELGGMLEQDLDKLIQGCTMQGGAHDALHAYLGELMPAVAELKTSGRAEHAEHIKHLLSIYQDYFE